MVRTAAAGRSWPWLSRSDRDNRGLRHRVGAAVGRVCSVTLVSLLEPRVAPIVVAVLFPETGLVVVEQTQPDHPLALFQKYR